MAKGRGRKTYLVVGLGRYGTSLCEKLNELGAHVIAVDKVRSRVEELSDKLEYVAQLDATDETSLAKIGAKEADVAVVCLGEKTEASILVTAILKEMGIPKIIARANDDLQARILSKVGAHSVVSPESDMGRRTADILENPWLLHFTEFDDSDLITGKIPAQPEMIGKSLKELALPGKYSATVTVVEREGRKLMANANLVILEGDSIWLFGVKNKLSELLKTIDIDK